MKKVIKTRRSIGKSISFKHSICILPCGIKYYDGQGAWVIR